ncbi:MAG: alpha-glucuronidase, partial [Bacteroidales bacterium]|nr:alpha-glucuronidase [Bacteroidales bacterium]
NSNITTIVYIYLAMKRIMIFLAAILAAGCANKPKDVLWLANGPVEPQGEPYYEYRILDHWDNLDDSVERGYAGKSIWEWTSPEIPVERIHTYGRLNKSLGINGSVLNNVNANPKILDSDHLRRVAQIADILREYGIRTYLSINFATPMALGELPTADPLDPAVAQWWKDKANEIYAIIPDFGGFLVKASSEGQPGPQDFGRTHVDGANMLADALGPHGGMVMWRAFVYAATSPDRANQAVEEFEHLDGQFRDNVIIQIKNGPVDFQCREPFSPLFGRMEKTVTMPELQVTQEYLGQSFHLVFLAPMWEEFFGDVRKYARLDSKAIAGVANTGQEDTWCGHVFSQANWYAFGRLAWDPTLTSEQIADEWIHLTFLKPWWCSKKRWEKEFVTPVKNMMLESREACVNYTMPLGFHHIFNSSHYGPGPWQGSIRPDWSPLYYHKAGPDGVGFDRTVATGSGNTAQYHEPFASMVDNLSTCPDKYLLWFHHLPWDYRMRSGRTLWDEICLHYQSGIDSVRGFLDTWAAVKKFVDEDTWNKVQERLVIQEADARWWRDACVQYFQTFSGMPVPSDVAAPEIPLDSLRRRRGNPPTLHQEPAGPSSF